MKIPLAVQFFLWIFGGLFFIVAAFGLTWHSACLSPSGNPKETGYQQDQRADDLRHLMDDSIWRATVLAQSNRTDTADKTKNADQTESNPHLLSVVCDAKITDWGLAFFTYALVIVGWFGIRSNERAIRDMERAVLFGGPFRPIWTGTKTQVPIVLENYGRTVGILKEIYVEFSTIEPTGPVVYNIANGFVDLRDEGFPPIRRAPHEPVPLAWACDSPHQGEHFVFGYFRYEDIFGREHRNLFCNKIDPTTPNIKIAGPRAWNGWD
jgi:hypothetical protein